MEASAARDAPRNLLQGMIAQVETHRNAVVLDLVFTPELVGELVPGGGHVVGALLSRITAREGLLPTWSSAIE